MNIHENAEKFDDRTEISMRYLNITACCDAFAMVQMMSRIQSHHSGLYGPYTNRVKCQKRNDLGDNAYWILSLGAFGIVIGLATYGYKILHAIGTKLTKITPSRGTCIELGSACVIIMGSRLGWLFQPHIVR